MNINYKNMRRAFTLIELIVVIVIIGIIASLTFVALNSVRAKARDTKRIADIRNLTAALEMYKNDHNVYPTYATSGTALVGTNGQTYMAKIPTAPTNIGTDVYTYTSTTGGTSYSIAYNLEKGVQDTNSGNWVATPEQISSPGSSGSAPAVFACGSNVVFDYMGSSVTYGTVVSTNNRCWMTRNLGAIHVATTSDDFHAYGDLFQWGRPVDGHQTINWTSATTGSAQNGTQPGPVNTLNPGTTFVTSGTGEWTSLDINPSGTIRSESWGANGSPNPCPSGWHVPTDGEWDAERLTWSPMTSAGAFASPLKLTVAGVRSISGSSFSLVGSDGNYWSSSASGSYSLDLYFHSGGAGVGGSYRAYGYPVRCLKDLSI